MFHTFSILKENGNFGMIEAASFQFQVTVQQLPPDLKSEMNEKLRDVEIDFAKSLIIIAENLEDLEEGTMELFKAISQLFVCVERLFKIKELIGSSYRGQPPLLPM